MCSRVTLDKSMFTRMWLMQEISLTNPSGLITISAVDSSSYQQITAKPWVKLKSFTTDLNYIPDFLYCIFVTDLIKMNLSHFTKLSSTWVCYRPTMLGYLVNKSFSIS